MSDRQIRPTEEDIARVDSLLGLFRQLSQPDPPPAGRERLEALALRRLSERPASAVQVRSARPGRHLGLKPALAVGLVALAVLTAVFTIHLRQREPVETRGRAVLSQPPFPPQNHVKVLPSPILSTKTEPRRQPAPKPPTGPRRMIMRLPYSDSAIETGTATTIRVSMSQSELFSMGFPVNATVQDRHVVAELTLGDDGLPRAISLPVPLEVTKEKQ